MTEFGILGTSANTKRLPSPAAKPYNCDTVKRAYTFIGRIRMGMPPTDWATAIS